MGKPCKVNVMMDSKKTLSMKLEIWAMNPGEACMIMVEKTSLVLEKKLRHLSKRRLTCRATWNEKAVIAKFFYGEKSKHYTDKESSALEGLKEAGIKAPQLLHVINTADVSIVIIDYIDESATLLEWLKTEPTPQQFERVLSKANTLMLACHKAGMYINDPHLDNFLLSKDEVYIVDAGDIKQEQYPLSTKDSIDNVALFYAQLPVRYDVIAYRLLTAELQKNKKNIVLTNGDWQQFLIKKRRWRQKKFIDKKVFRECSAYICKQDKARFSMFKRDIYSAELALALSSPDILIQNGTLLKNGGTATVALVEIAGIKYVLKRYNIKKPVHAVIRGLKWSRAAVSWKNGLLLEMLGIPTAKSYAMIEERRGPLRRRSYLLSEYIDAPQAWDVFEDTNIQDKEKENWAEKIYELFLFLKRAQISHGDLKAQNILCSFKGPVFIDLDGLQSNQCYQSFLRQFKKDMQRFLISWPERWTVNPYFKERAAMLTSKSWN